MITLAMTVIAVGLGAFAARWYHRHGLPVIRSLGLGVNRWTPVDLLVGLLIVFATVSGVWVVERALGAIQVTATGFAWSALPGTVGQIVFFAGFEELLFRVCALSAAAILLRRLPYGRWLAVVAIGLLFGAVHLGNENATMIGAFGTGLGGMMYGIAFYAARSVWLPLAMHVSWNLSQALWGFPVSGTTDWPGFVVSTSVGDELLNGGAYGPEGGIPGMLARFVIMALVLAYARWRWPDGSLRRLTYAPQPVPRQGR